MDKPDLALSRTFILSGGALQDLDDAAQTSSAQTSAGLTPGALLDSKYEVIELIGKGGMGAVYKVRHRQLNRDVALKTFLTDALPQDAWLRFQREAQAIAKLNDSNIIKILDFGIGEKNVPYYTMELLDGQSLAEKLAQSGPLSQLQALRLFSKVARGMQHAHNLNIVHRDIKPANIFLTNEESDDGPNIKLVDFGISKLLTEGNLESQQLTHTGLVFGSPLYMSPEQSLGKTVDARSDIYSFGCTLFESLTGVAPFVGVNAFATMMLHQNQIAPTLAEKNPRNFYDRRLESMIAKLLAKTPSRRYQTFDEILNELTRLETEAQSQAHSTRPASPPPETDPRSLAYISDTGARDTTTVQTKRPVNRVLWAALLTGALLAVGGGFALHTYFQPTTPAKPNAPSQPTATDAKEADSAPSSIKSSSQPHGAFVRPHSFYSRITPSGTRIFEFEAGDDIGKLYLVKAGNNNKPIHRANRQNVPPDKLLHLTAGRSLVNHPELFERFRANDFVSLKLEGGPDWTYEHFKRIGHLTGLQWLYVSDAKLDGHCFAALHDLSNLTNLEIPDCETTAEDIVQFKHLDHLYNLNCDSVGTMTKVLLKLAPSNSLGTLAMERCNLTDSDLAIIAQIKTLTELHIEGNTAITEKGLAELATLPVLRTIYLDAINLPPNTISTLSKFKHLTRLRFNESGWTESQVKRLKSLLPHDCIISNSGLVKL